MIQHEAWLSQSVPPKGTRGSNLRKALLKARTEKARAFHVRQLTGPAVPIELQYLYKLWGQFKASRRYTMDGLAPATYGDVVDFANAMHVRILARDAEALVHLSLTEVSWIRATEDPKRDDPFWEAWARGLDPDGPAKKGRRPE